MKENLEQTLNLKHMESMDVQITRLRNIIKANSSKQTSNNELIQAYIEKTGRLSEDEIDSNKKASQQ